VTSSPETIEAQLLALADQYDEAAGKLRQAAAVVRGVPTLPSAQTLVTRPTTASANGVARSVGITEAEYLGAMRADPDRSYDADEFAAVLKARGLPVASVDAVRTALYRLEKGGKIAKAGRGRFQLLDRTPSLIQSGEAASSGGG
jgi:hypothetical protein